MKSVPLKRYKTKDGFVLAALVKMGVKVEDVADARKKVILLQGRDVRELLALFIELKRRKIRTSVNFHPIERYLRKLKNGTRDSQKPPVCPNRKRTGGNQPGKAD